MDEQTLAAALSDPEYPPRLLCANCGSMIGGDSTWRWNGKSWEHRCSDASPYLGHYTPNLVKPSEVVAALRTASAQLAQERERVKMLERIYRAAAAVYEGDDADDYAELGNALDDAGHFQQTHEQQEQS